MILPIRAIGDPVLKRKGEDLKKGHAGLDKLIDNMFETMYNAQGVGLAAPQIGESLRLFVVDTGKPTEDDGAERVKEVFINPEIIDFVGNEEPFEEGCLSIPNIREEIYRPEGVSVRYFNEHFEEKKMVLNGLLARVFQHEFDHLEGILFTDLVSPLKRRMLKSKLDKIARGKVKSAYPMKFVR
ncbi:MAG: peptide deformylase [Bacteroidetes bacterium]|nr:peptide deformylase [Bacteroidota bacterium]